MLHIYLLKKYNSDADDEGKDEEADKVETLLLAAYLVSDIEQLPESDDGDVHDVVACGRLQ